MQLLSTLSHAAGRVLTGEKQRGRERFQLADPTRGQLADHKPERMFVVLNGLRELALQQRVTLARDERGSVLVRLHFYEVVRLHPPQPVAQFERERAVVIEPKSIRHRDAEKRFEEKHRFLNEGLAAES